MNEIRLEDGSLLEIKVNFLTVKLMVDMDIEKLAKKNEKKPNDDKLRMNLAAKMIYIILRSNGKKVDEEEACRLVPFDDHVITDLFNAFGEKVEKFKKKQANKL